jgi:LuxR family maltose regulon positive regulatory protein
MISATISFGAWLRQTRLAADFTQERLAEAVGCAAETIRSFENGRRRPSHAMAQRLATVLAIPPAEQQRFLAYARGVALPDPPAPLPPPAPDPLPLLHAKLYRPRPRTDMIARPRLVARLQTSAAPVVLIAAQAGAGKTTLLSAWLDQPDAPPFAWLALDPHDADPSVFVRLLIAALQTLAPTVGAAALRMLHPGQTPAINQIMPLLCADLPHLPDQSVLILDDYHVIETPLIHEVLNTLVAHLPPQLRLVIASRVDPPLPLSRLRARGDLLEVRADDLRFTPAETAAFYQQRLTIPLPPTAIQTLERRTEGWAVGLHLAALALQQHTDPLAFVQQFAGSNRFVVDYLVEEVLAQLPAHLHDFVLQTALLDQLCGSLCDALLGLETPADAPAYSQMLLETLERANVFLVPLDAERRWYRYHHLFGEVMRVRLRQGASPAQIRALHMRASRWYAQTDLPNEAIHHALAAEDWAHVVALLVPRIPQVVGRGEFHTGLRWLRALPDAVVQRYPLMGIYRAGVLMYQNQVLDAVAALDLAEQSLIDPLSPLDPAEIALLRGQAAVIRGATSRIMGDLPACIQHSQTALALLPPTESTPLKLRPLAQLNLLRAFLVTGDASPSTEAQAEAVLGPLRTTGNLFALLTSITNVARIRTAQGRLREAAATYAQAQALVAAPHELTTLVGGAAYYCGLGDIHREWGELDTAAELLQIGQALCAGSLTVDADARANVAIAVARLATAQGDLPRAMQHLSSFLGAAHTQPIAPYLIERVQAEQAWLHARQGDLLRASHWADQRAQMLLADPGYLYEPECLIFAAIRAAEAQYTGDLARLVAPRALLDRLLDRAEAQFRRHSSIQILVLRAQSHTLMGTPDQSHADRSRAHAYAAPAGYQRVFHDLLITETTA